MYELYESKYVKREDKALKEMAKNSDVVETFCLDFKPDLRVRTQNVNLLEVEDGYVLINYATPIAVRKAKRPEGWTIYLNTDKYSSTTSTIQNKIRVTCESGEVELEEVSEKEIKNLAMTL